MLSVALRGASGDPRGRREMEKVGRRVLRIALFSFNIFNPGALTLKAALVFMDSGTQADSHPLSLSVSCL